MYTYISEFDMFGHPILMNFERKGDSHQTFIGGIFSFFIKTFMTFYVVLCFKSLIFREKDNNFTTFGSNQLNSVIDYNVTKLTLLHVLRKQRTEFPNPLYQADLRKFIYPYFEEMKVDWYKPANGGRYTVTRIPARVCNRTDFGPLDNK
jgi:hypothetical protein